MRFIKYVVFFLGLSIVSCSDEDKGNIEKSPIEYSFFIAGHTYGAPGIDNEGVHPPFKNKVDCV